MLTLYCDGASRGNPGPGACGFIILDDGKPIHREGVRLGLVTNNVAEYEGLVRGLRKCIDLGATEVSVRSDSELLVRQLNGEYRVKAAGLRALYTQARTLIQELTKIDIQHVPREENKLADSLCNDALDGLLQER